MIKKQKFKYENLEKHFTSPKKKIFYKKLPRKLKKQINKFISENDNTQIQQAKNYELNIKMWYLRWYLNPDYNRFLIKEICKNKNNWKWY